MPQNEFSVEFPRSGVALIAIDRPPANALTTTTVEALTRKLDELADSKLGVVIASKNPRFFCAGGDINDFAALDGTQLGHRMNQFHRWLVRLQTYPGPLACAVTGTAVGAGCEILLHADRVFASGAARFGFPEITNGVLPAAKGIVDLIQTIGRKSARKLLLSGKLVSAESAGNLGLVDEIVDDTQVVDYALDYVEACRQHPPLLFALLKEQINGDRVPSNEELEQISVEYLNRYRLDGDVAQARSRWAGTA